jgi:hypothetical protein
MNKRVSVKELENGDVFDLVFEDVSTGTVYTINDNNKDVAVLMPYDTKVTVEIELSDSIFNGLALMAHEKDITFNQLVTEILMEYIQKEDIKCK